MQYKTIKAYNMANDLDPFEQEYENKFGWRKARQIYNLRDIANFTQLNGVHSIDSFPCLFTPNGDSPRDALRYSILLLAYEATECYVFGEFQSCMLVCGALVERILKLEYLEKNPQMPQKGEWTLGRCIYQLNWERTRITPEILALAKQMLDPRNSRAHALLEHSNPQLSIMGGNERGIEILDSEHYLIEPYRCEAKLLVGLTFKILAMLYK